MSQVLTLQQLLQSEQNTTHAEHDISFTLIHVTIVNRFTI